MKNLTEITAIVRAYLVDDSAVVTQPILDSVNFLSNFFSIDTFDESQSTAVDGTTLDIPDECIEVDAVFIDGEEVRKLKRLDDLETVRETEQQRWYEFNGKIQFTEVFTSTLTTKILYKCGFFEPTAADDTDVPARYMELVYLGAQYRYYNLLLSKQVQTKSDMADIKPNEIRAMRDDVKKTYFETLKNIQINNE